MKIKTEKNSYIIDYNIKTKKKLILVRIIKGKQLGSIYEYTTSVHTSIYEILKDCIDLIHSHEIEIYTIE